MVKGIQSLYEKKITFSLTYFNRALPIFLILVSFNGIRSQTTTQNSSQIDSVTRMPIDSVLSWMRANLYENTTTYPTIGLKAIQLIKDKKTPLKKAELHEEMANWYGYHGLFPQDSVVYHSEKTLAYYQKLGNNAKVASSYRVLAIDYLNQNELTKSQKVLFKALSLFEELDDEQGMANAYRVLADLHEKMLKPEEAIAYAELAIAIFKKYDNHSATCIALFNIIKANTTMGEYSTAYKAADECIAIVKNKVPDDIFVLIRAYSYRSDISIKTKDYNQALADCKMAYKLAVDAVGEERAATYRTDIGNVLKFQGKYTEAIHHFEAGIAALEKQESNNIWEVYDQVSECYENLNDEKNALIYFKKSVAIKNKVMKDKVANLESEAVIKYETGKKMWP